MAIDSALKERVGNLIRNGFPPQYLIGGCEFLGEDLIITPGTFIPRPETEPLVEHILNHGRYKTGLEIGVGSGAIAIGLLTKEKDLFMIGTETSPIAIETCFFNLKVRDLFGRMVLILTSRIDIFKEASFDLIVSNPPYIPTRILSRLPLRVRYEPRVAIDGGDDGLVVVEEILTVATDLLRSGGLLALEIDPLISPKVRDLSSAFDFKIYKDYRGQDRYLIGVR